MYPRKLSDKQEIMICREYIKGAYGTKLSKKYKVSNWVIYNTLKKYNIKKRSPKELHRKYYCDFHFFNKIDTEEKAYWLGFITADGHITKDQRNCLMIELAIKDREQLEKFLISINSSNPIFEHQRKNHHRSCSICISSFDFTENLKKQNFFSVPDKLKRHFIRGLFDGDGYISSKFILFDITGKMLFMKDIQNYLVKNTKLNKTKLIKCYNSISFRLQYCGKNNIQKVYDFLYKDATIFMERKYNRFLKILK